LNSQLSLLLFFIVTDLAGLIYMHYVPVKARPKFKYHTTQLKHIILTALITIYLTRTVNVSTK